MPFQVHDPYLNTVKRELDDQYYKNKRASLSKKRKQTESKGFLSKKVHLSDFINLPEGTLNMILFGAFIIIPYFTGLIFIFIIISDIDFDFFDNIKSSDYLIYWSIGYEVLASILMLLLIKSAISFKMSR